MEAIIRKSQSRMLQYLGRSFLKQRARRRGGSDNLAEVNCK